MARVAKDARQAFAVVRVDGVVGGPEDQTRITVKEVVTQREIALAEVERLNKLNEQKDCWYFWQVTRLFDHGDSFGTHPVDDGQADSK